MPTNPTPAQMHAAAVGSNMAARDAIVHGTPNTLPAINSWQQIFQATYTSGVGTNFSVVPKNVGLIKRFLVKVSATITAGATSQQNLTSFGPANFFSNITLWDFDNQQRINSHSWFLQLLASAKRRHIFGAADTNDNPFGYGSNYTVNKAASSIAATANTTIDFFVELPCSYTDFDLRGAIWAGITNNNMQLSFTVNQNMLVASTDDPTLAVYQSAGADKATLTSFTITIFQNFLQQLPRDSNNQVILPMLDLGTAYLINTSSTSLPVVNMDNSIAYPNFRDIMSTGFVYDNAGSLNAGSDITSFALQTANFTNLWKYDPITAMQLARNILHDDPPAGMYYFDHRERPINTNQYGNMELLINPSSVGGSTATFLYGMEMLAFINAVTQAGSLQAP